jgi:hypothetical protein
MNRHHSTRTPNRKALTAALSGLVTSLTLTLSPAQSSANTLNTETTTVLTATCLTMDSVIMGMSVTGFGDADQAKTFTISVERDGTLFVNGRPIEPKYWEHDPSGTLLYTAIPMPELSMAVEGKLSAVQMLPNMSAEDLALIEGVTKGMFGMVMGDRERIFLVDPSQDTYLFADVEDGTLTNVANIRCG